MAEKLIKVDKNGTKYYVSDVCPKCNGLGRIGYYSYIDDGLCFKCGGTGIYITKWKEYTEEYQKILDERRLNKKKKASPEYNKKFLESNGFGEDLNTYVVIGNTYEIKDQLKEHGAKFNPALGWHFNFDNKEYNCLKIGLDEVTYKDNLDRYCFIEYDKIKQVINSKLPKEESNSEYYGNEGDNIDLTLSFSTRYRYQARSYNYYEDSTTKYIYKFIDDLGNIFIWNTSSFLSDMVSGNKYQVKGVIKQHKEYKGDKQTILTRCKINPLQS